jgi:hypothetical protein
MDGLPALSAALHSRPNDFLAATLFAARLADILSTRMASPRLQLEANPIVRKLGWPFAWSTLAVCLVAYLPDYGPAIAVSAIVVSFLVAGGNLSRGWAMRALGEQAYRAHLERVASSARPAHAYLAIAAGSGLVAIVGALLLAFYPDSREPADWFAMGILLYAFAVWLHSSIAVHRLRQQQSRREMRRDPRPAPTVPQD